MFRTTPWQARFPYGSKRSEERRLPRRSCLGFNALNKFHYVYILVSEADDTRHYIGLTENIESRLIAHNSGKVPHTSKYRPWKIETVIAFRSREKAANFEKYLKSHSGRAFAKKRL